MEKGKLLGLIVVLIVIVGVIFLLSTSDKSVDNYGSVSNSDPLTISETSGEVLAGSSESKYVEFTQSEYERALAENKKILLYFYASWCPTCRAEQPATISAFEELNDPNTIGFRVNYKDSATDSYEEALAEEFAITYQHTKVILVGGKQVLKSLEGWDKNRYLEELRK